MSDCGCIKLDVPNLTLELRPGTRIKLSRFAKARWTVCYGWYSVGGNRPICGWYLKSDDGLVRSLQLPDLEDIYIVEL